MSTDREQDLVIDADRAELDDGKNVVVYRGNVVVTQGSLRMTGDTMTVHFNDEGAINLVVVLGEPATYRQRPDDSEVYDEAGGRRVEYYALRDQIILIDKAWVKQENMRFSGSRIEYDTVSSKAVMKGRQQISDDGSGRVRTIIKPESESENE